MAVVFCTCTRWGLVLVLLADLIDISAALSIAPSYKLSAGAIIGIVLGCLVSTAIIVGIIVCSVVMCRNSRLKRQQAACSQGVIYQQGQGVTLVPVAQGQMNPCGGVVYQPVPMVAQQMQPNIQAGHVVQYPTHPQTIQLGQGAHVQSAT